MRPHRGTIARVVALLVLIAVASCGDPFSYRYANSRPSESDLVGDYHLEFSTEPFVGSTPPRGERSASEHRLFLRPDDSFDAREFPIWRELALGASYFGSFEVAGFESFSGRWRLVGLRELEFDAPGREPMHAFVARDEPPHELIFRYGDPDAGDAMFFWRDDDTRGRIYDPRDAPTLAAATLFWLAVVAAVCVALAAAALVVFALLASAAAVVAAFCFAIPLFLGLFVALLLSISNRISKRLDSARRTSAS